MQSNNQDSIPATVAACTGEWPVANAIRGIDSEHGSVIPLRDSRRLDNVLWYE